MSEVPELDAVKGLMSAYTEHYNRLRSFNIHQKEGGKLNQYKQQLATLKTAIKNNNGQLPTGEKQNLDTLEKEILKLDETLAYRRSIASDESLGKTIEDYEKLLDLVKEELEGIKTLPITQTQNPNLRNKPYPLENAQSQANKVKHQSESPIQNQAA